MTSHILFTSNSAWSLWLFSRAAILDCINRGHRVSLLAPYDSVAQDLKALGCQFIPLKLNERGIALYHDLKLLRQFQRVLRKQKPDLVYTSTIKCNIYGTLAAKSLNIPAVPTITRSGWAMNAGGLTQWIVNKLYKAALAKLPIVFFLQENARRIFVERQLASKECAIVLPSACVDLEGFVPQRMIETEEAITFLMIGRLIRDKGLLDFVRAARLVRLTNPEARFHLLGQLVPNHPNAVDEEMITFWQKEEYIEFLGSTKDPRPFISQASCIVLPSHKESAPRVLIEAAAMARPVIASDLEECAAIVEDRKTGFLYHAKSSAGLTEACKTFLSLSRREREEMGLAGRKRAEKMFDQTIMMHAYRKAAERNHISL